MIFSSIPLASSAQDQSNFDTQTTNETKLKGSNTLGGIVSDLSGDEAENSPYSINSVVIKEKTATVTFTAPINDTTLIVAVYNENEEMILCGNSTVNSEKESAEIELSGDSLPTYYKIKAFMVDENKVAVCKNYEDIEHTKAYEEYIDQTIYDFDDEQVINLDNTYDNNFAIVSDDAEVLKSTETKNTVYSYDEETGIYIIENADSKMKNLKIGETVYMPYGNEDDYVLTKVGSITVSGDRVTITPAEDYEISDFFDYIKIDTETQGHEIQESPSLLSAMFMTAGAEDVYEDDEGDVKKTYSSSIEVKKTYESSDKLFSVDFSGKLYYEITICFRYSAKLFGKDYYYFKNVNSINFDASTTISMEKDLIDVEPLCVAHAGIPIFTGIEAEIAFYLSIKLTAKIEGTGSIIVSISKGMEACSETGTKKIESSPNVEVKFEIEASLTLTIEPTLEIGFKFVKVFSVGVSVKAPITIKMSLDETVSSEEDGIIYPQSIHNACLICIKGTMKLGFKGEIPLKFGLLKKHEKTVATINLFSAEMNLGPNDGKFYISIGSENGLLNFGWGDCPNIKYRTEFVIYNEDETINNDYNTLVITSINEKKSSVTQNSKGKYISYFSDGKYRINLVSEPDIELDTEKMNNDGFIVNKNSQIVKIYIRKNKDVTKISGGKCGDSVSWVLYSNGGLIISGNGRMDSYSGYPSTPVAPWSSYKNEIKFIEIKKGITSIGNYAFSGCTGLTSITIPDSVTSIGRCAFQVCRGLTSITIPDSVTSIENNPFSSCTVLTTITVDVNNKYYDSRNNCNAIIETATNTLVAGCKNTGIPDSVTSIGAYAFSECIGLTSVTIGNSVTSIGADAFSQCRGLTSVTIGNSVKSIARSAFFGCTGLTSITIPNSVTSIGNDAFFHCTGLTSITIPDSVTSIGNYAFKNTGYSNNSSNWENDVLFIGNHLIEAKTSIRGSYTIKAGTICIADAFHDCTGLTSVTIPDSVTSIGSCAFQDCTGLTSITIGNSVTSIGSYAFQDCSGLKSITIPDSVTSIGYCAFKGCKNLTSITIGNSVTSIGSYAFQDCRGLTSITIPDSVTSIGDLAFSDCKGLTSITIPDSVTSIGYGAFYGCTGLTDVYYTGTASQWKNITIDLYNTFLTNATIHYNSTPSQNTAPRAMSPVLSMFSLTASAVGEAVNTAKTATRGYVKAGTEYVLFVVKDKNAENYFSPDNILYIDQVTATDSSVSFTYYTDYENPFVLITGECTHKETEKITAKPNCTTSGLKSVVCEICGEALKENIEIKALGHTGGTANCKDKAVCTRCKQAYGTVNTANHKSIVTDKAVAATCTATGLTEGKHCSACNTTIVKQTTIQTIDHADNNGDGKCDSCGYQMSDPSAHCTCKCHQGGFNGFLWKILRIFYKLFGTKQYCACGAKHW